MFALHFNLKLVLNSSSKSTVFFILDNENLSTLVPGSRFLSPNRLHCD